MIPQTSRFLRGLALAAALAALADAAAARPFTFVALGDMPYGKPEEVYEPFRALIEEINGRWPAVVVHVGDTRGGGVPCSDEILDAQLGFLNSFEAAALYSPGDNEWADCSSRWIGSYDPFERLARIRQTYFADPATSFGRKPAAVAHQGETGYPENARLIHEGVVFITAHMIGPRNRSRLRGPASVAEGAARGAAAVDWLVEGFAAAAEAGAEAVVVAIHANMFRSNFDHLEERWSKRSDFREFGNALRREAVAYGGPVLLVFGATHDFRVFRPLPKTAPNLTAVEVFGSSKMHAVAVRVATSSEEVFTVAPVLNPAWPAPKCLQKPCIPAHRDPGDR